MISFCTKRLLAAQDRKMILRVVQVHTARHPEEAMAAEAENSDCHQASEHVRKPDILNERRIIACMM